MKSNIKSATEVQIYFHKRVRSFFYRFEAELFRKLDFKHISKEKADLMISKARLNLFNYELLNNLQNLKYKKVEQYYQSKEAFNKLELLKKEVIGNDVTSIIKLFLPNLIDDMNKKSTPWIPRIETSDVAVFRLREVSDKLLEENIKEFLMFMETIKKEKRFDMHRREVFLFLQSFLTIYANHDKDKITDEEKKYLFYFHYFRPFLKPEDYLKYSGEENQI